MEDSIIFGMPSTPPLTSTPVARHPRSRPPLPLSPLVTGQRPPARNSNDDPARPRTPEAAVIFKTRPPLGPSPLTIVQDGPEPKTPTSIRAVPGDRMQSLWSPGVDGKGDYLKSPVPMDICTTPETRFTLPTIAQKSMKTPTRVLFSPLGNPSPLTPMTGLAQQFAQLDLRQTAETGFIVKEEKTLAEEEFTPVTKLTQQMASLALKTPGAPCPKMLNFDDSLEESTSIEGSTSSSGLSESSIVNKSFRGRDATFDVDESLLSMDEGSQEEKVGPLMPILTAGLAPHTVDVFAKLPGKDTSSSIDAVSCKEEKPLESDQPPTTVEPTEVDASKHLFPKQLPRFYYPRGAPLPEQLNEDLLDRARAVFLRNSGKCDMLTMGEVCMAVELPFYCRQPITVAIAGNEEGIVSFDQFEQIWTRMCMEAHDDASRVVFTLTKGRRTHLKPTDFIGIIWDVIHTAPSLEFLRASIDEYRGAYCGMVIANIYWNVCKSWNEKLTIPELRSSKFLDELFNLQDKDVAKDSTLFFSYTSFFVVHSIFIDLDSDQDMFLTKDDLCRYSNAAIPPVVVDRIFSRAVRRGEGSRRHLSFWEFAMFLMADEDKTHAKSLEYWFRVFDRDGDGRLTIDDVEFFFKAMVVQLGTCDTLSLSNVVSMFMELICPKHEWFELSDLKRRPAMAKRLLNHFVNADKFFAQETTDEVPMPSSESDWQKFCKVQFEKIVREDANASNGTVTLYDTIDLVDSSDGSSNYMDEYFNDNASM